MERIRALAGTAPEPYWVSIVEDDEAVTDALTNLLESVGLRVEALTSAEELLDSNRLRNKSCVILDVQLPHMNGLELQRRLSNAAVSIPIIFITAHADEELRNRALQDGAVGFFYKPFATEALLGAVYSTLKYRPAKGYEQL